MVESEIGKDAPALPPKKVFRSKFDLQQVQTYRKPPTEAYWEDWPKLTYEEAIKVKSSIDPAKLEELANKADYPYSDLLEVVLRDVEEGTDIGVIIGSDVPSDSTNAPSAFEFGAQVSDSICKMISEGN